MQAVQARIYAREIKQEDIICGIGMMNHPFYPSDDDDVEVPAASTTAVDKQCESVHEEYDDSISDSELANISPELFQSKASPALVTPVKESKKRPASPNITTQEEKNGHNYGTRSAGKGKKQK